jgi:CHAT domain-containing protein
MIVADGVLHYIPFAALPSPDTRRPLIARHELVSLPSASVLAEMRRDLTGRKAAAKAVAVFADPVFNTDDPRLKPESDKSLRQSGRESSSRDLERAMRDLGVGERFTRLSFSRREAQAIASIAPAGQVMKALDFEASRATATAAGISQYRVVHFATHGLLNSEHPELSGVVLSLVDRQGQPQNGFLRLHDVYNLKLPAELIVLSACETGLGKEIRGEGIVGLTRGFMYAGAARVVASLWRVDDAATSEVMKLFYRGMFNRGLRPAAALREAQVEIWKQDRWRSPYFWAAFTLQGEYR